MQQWYAYVGGVRYGPVPWETLQSWAAEGRLKAQDFVWTAGMGDWAGALTIPGLLPRVSRGGGGGVPYPAANVRARPGTGGHTRNGKLTARGRRRLSGRWGLPIAFCLLLFLIDFAVSNVPWIGGLISLALAGPFAFGSALFFLVFSRGGHGDLGMMFSGFRRFGTAIGAYMWMFLLLLLWGLSGGAIGAAVGGVTGLAVRAIAGVQWSLEYWLWISGGLGAAVMYTYGAMSYSQTFYILCDHPHCGAIEAVSDSRDLMIGHKAKLFWLHARFAGWMALSVFTLFIGMLWLIPYMYTALACFYDDLQRPADPGPAPQPQANTQPAPNPAQATVPSPSGLTDVQAADKPSDSSSPSERRMPPDPDSWFYIEDEGVRGPVDKWTLRRDIKAGQVSEEALVWQPGRAIWRCAARVDELSPIRTRRSPELALPHDRDTGTGGATPNADIIRAAQDALEGSWARSAVFCAGVILVLTTLAMFGHVGGLPLAFLVAGQFCFAAALFFLTLVRRGKARVGMLSAGFRRPIRAFASYLGVLLVLLPYAVGGWIIGMVLGVAAGGLWAVARGTFDVMATSWLWGGVVCASGFGVLAWVSYCQTPFIMVDHPDRSVFQALKTSADMMNGRRGKYVRLCLYFLVWFVPVVLSLGVASLWMFPLMGASAAAFYDDLRPPPVASEKEQPNLAETEKDPDAGSDAGWMLPDLSNIARRRRGDSRPGASTIAGP